MLIEDRDITSYQLFLKQDRDQSTCFFDQWIFRKKWVGRAMGNETFYWDGLMVGYGLAKVLRGVKALQTRKNSANRFENLLLQGLASHSENF